MDKKRGGGFSKVCEISGTAKRIKSAICDRGGRYKSKDQQPPNNVVENVLGRLGENPVRGGVFRYDGQKTLRFKVGRHVGHCRWPTNTNHVNIKSDVLESW